MKLALALIALMTLPATAQAAADIEGSWAFSGGAVAIQPGADGSAGGVVTRDTTLDDCPHTVGEVIWTGFRPQPDGQWFGGHQWFESSCAKIAARGNTAMRVLKKPGGQPFLRVCFARPDTPELQPSIAPDGTSANAVACVDSDFIATVTTPTFASTVIAPSTRTCRSRRSFRIRLKEPQGDSRKSATVFLNGKQKAKVTGARLTADIDLTGLPKGKYTVRIVATTTLRRTITGSRTYRTCAPKTSSR